MDPFAFLDAYGITDTGQKRTENQDSILVRTGDGVFVVADGVGGLTGGQLASTSITDGIDRLCTDNHSRKYFSDLKEKETIIKLRLLQLNDWLINQADSARGFHPCSTVTLVIFAADQPDRASAMHLGDSNLYRIRDGQIESMIELHEDNERTGHAITRAMGSHTPLKVEHTMFITKPDDYYLICSDGLYRMLSDQEIAGVFRDKRDAGVQAITQTLINYANLGGGTDNISAVVIHIKPDELPLPKVEDATVEFTNDPIDPDETVVDVRMEKLIDPEETIAG